MKPPNMLLALSDAPRALADAAFLNMAAPLLRKLPRTNRQHGVMVIPGFLGDDGGNRPLIQFLRHLGYTASGWQQVITLGSPFGRGRQDASHANRLYRRLNPKADERDNDDALATPPPVPTTAIYTKGDGVVNWRTSLQMGENHGVHNIRVTGSHIGLNLNAVVWFWIAKKLAEM